MIKLYDVVRIKDSGITGIVTNISSTWKSRGLGQKKPPDQVRGIQTIGLYNAIAF